MRDPYLILGVERGADAKAIKGAYRELTRRFHPDVQRGRAWAGEFYREIVDAYAILGDARARALYDEFGELSLTRGFDPARARAHRERAHAEEARSQPSRRSPPPAPEPEPAGDEGEPGTDDGGEGLDFEDLQHARRTFFDDILDRVWRGRSVRLDDEEPASEVVGTGRDARAEVMIPLAKAVVGCTIHVRVRDPREASGVRVVEVPIPAGLEDETLLIVKGEGEGGDPPGSLHVLVRVKHDPTLRREGLDLHLDVPVTLLELYRGGSIEVSTPRGLRAVQIPAACRPDWVLRLRGQGVQADRASGDLHLRLRPQLPTAGDAELLRVLERLQGATRARG